MGEGGLRKLLARCSFPPPGTEIDCAVSGGADSSALVVLGAAAGCRVTAIHVDHGLRAGSSAEADVVRRTADRFGAAFRSVRVEVEPGASLEARARSARYAALPRRVMTGHTADDQAETILLALLRGSSTRGLAGMRTGDDGHGVRRPLLALRRAETVELCAHLGVEVVHDPTNHDLRFTRNRIRAEVLPLLAAVAQRDVVPILCRQAELLRDDDELLEQLAADIDATDARALARTPAPLARRAVRAWLAASDRDHRAPASAAVQRALDVARGRRRAADVAGALRVRRTAGRLRIERAEAPGSPRAG